MTVNDEVARRAELVVARTGLQERSALKQREPLLYEVSGELVFLAVEHALAHIGIGCRITAKSDAESAVVRRKRRPTGNARKVVAWHIWEGEPVVSRRRSEVMHVAHGRAYPRSHEFGKCFRQPWSKSENEGIGRESRGGTAGLDVLQAAAIAVSKRRVSQQHLTAGLTKSLRHHFARAPRTHDSG